MSSEYASLIAELTTLDGRRNLGLLRVTDEHSRSEAQIHRGLFLSGCRPESMLRHVVYAAANALPAESVIAASSYDFVEEIGELIGEMGSPVWRGARLPETDEGSESAAVHVAVPEQLPLISSRIRSRSFVPRYLHIVDPRGSLSIAPIGGPNRGIPRANAIGVQRAEWAVSEIRPYVILWTCHSSRGMNTRCWARSAGIDAWRYADGRTLRTASAGRLCA
jgi:hypothetical protein